MNQQTSFDYSRGMLASVISGSPNQHTTVANMIFEDKGNPNSDLPKYVNIDRISWKESDHCQLCEKKFHKLYIGQKHHW